MKIIKGPGKFNWAMGLIDGKVLEITLDETTDEIESPFLPNFFLRVVGSFQEVDETLSLFWGYITPCRPQRNMEFLKKRFRLDRHFRKGDIQFITGIYYHQLHVPKHRGWIMPCNKDISELMKPLLDRGVAIL